MLKGKAAKQGAYAYQQPPRAHSSTEEEAAGLTLDLFRHARRQMLTSDEGRLDRRIRRRDADLCCGSLSRRERAKRGESALRDTSHRGSGHGPARKQHRARGLAEHGSGSSSGRRVGEEDKGKQELERSRFDEGHAGSKHAAAVDECANGTACITAGGAHRVEEKEVEESEERRGAARSDGRRQW